MTIMTHQELETIMATGHLGFRWPFPHLRIDGARRPESRSSSCTLFSGLTGGKGMRHEEEEKDDQTVKIKKKELFFSNYTK